MEGDLEQDNLGALQQGSRIVYVCEKLNIKAGSLNSSSDDNIQMKCLIEERDESGICPVHLAAMMGFEDIMNEFIECMPDCVDIRTSDGKTPLHFAVENGQLQVVKMLLLNKEDKYFKKMVSLDSAKDGNTALHLAVSSGGDTQIVLELLKRPGIDVNAVNKAGLTALDIAAYNYTVLYREDGRRSKCREIKTILEEVGGCGRYSRPSEGKDSKIVDVDIVVASLIATITFAAILVEWTKTKTMYSMELLGWH